MSEKRQDLRAVLKKVEEEGELVRIGREVDPLLEMPAVVRGMAKLSKIPTLLFENIKGFPGVKGCATLFANRARVLRLFGLPSASEDLKRRCLEMVEKPLESKRLDTGPCKENIHHAPCDLGKIIFPTRGSSQSKHLYYQPVVLTKHPVTGQVNAAMYRCTLDQPGRITVNLRATQHGGLQLQAAKEIGVPLQVAICLGVHPALEVAATAQLPFGYSEVGFAGALLGEPLEMVKAESVDLEVPANAEVVIEGEIRPPYPLGEEGPWPEYFGYLGMTINPPLMDITAITHRNQPINSIFIPGSVPAHIGFVNESLLLRALRQLAGEFVVDVAFTPGARWHHAIIKVRKNHPHHEGYQLNVALSAFSYCSATSMDLVILVDEDIDIRNFTEVDWAVATRCNPAKQVHILPEARCHQNNPIAGVRELSGEPITKGRMIIDATIPWAYKVAEKSPGITFFTRSKWPDVDLKNYLTEIDLRRFSG